MTTRAWVIIAIELLLSMVLVYVLLGQVNAEKKRADDAESLAKQQGAVIAMQTFQFNRFNEIVANQQQYAVVLTGRKQEKETEYRTILKTEPTCALPVPAGVAGRLLEYTNSLRARAMRADPGIADSAGTGPTASGTLTYCQAVLWIDPLLSVIDQANRQLSGIREIDAVRGQSSQK